MSDIDACDAFTPLSFITAITEHSCIIFSLMV